MPTEKDPHKKQDIRMPNDEVDSDKTNIFCHLIILTKQNCESKRVRQKMYSLLKPWHAWMECNTTAYLWTNITKHFGVDVLCDPT